MNKEKITNIFDIVEDKVQVIGAKVSNQRHLASIRDAFASFIPFIIVGSFAILINSVFIQPNSLLASLCGAGTGVDDNAELYASWAKVSMFVSPLFTGITGATMDFFAIYISILLGYFLAGTYGDNKMFGGLISLACFLALQPTSALAGDPTGYFNSTGVLFAMVAGLLGPTIFHHISASEKLKVKMPDGVPPAIAKSFDALFPIMFTIIAFASFQPIWGAFAYLVGFGADTSTNTFYTITGSINYALDDSVGANNYDLTGTINIEQGTGLYTAMNLLDKSNLIATNEWTNLPAIPENWENGYVEDNLTKLWWLNEWFTNQVISIIGKDGLWFNISINYGEIAGDPINTVYDFVVETVKVIDQDWYYLVNTVNSLIVLPLQNAGDTAWFVFIIMFLYTFIFFFGIHGGNALAPITSPIFVVAILHNVDVLGVYGSTADAVASGELIVFTDQTSSSFLAVGGAGATMGLTIALYCFSKSPTSREVNKVGTAPSIFNINEPYIFGLPIMLNPIYALPFIMLNPILGVIIYYITAIGWMNPTMFYLPWTFPFGISGLIATADPRSIIVSMCVLLGAFLSYTPFVFLDARAQVKAQLVKNENKEYGTLLADLKEVRKGLSINPSDKKLVAEKNKLRLEIKIMEDEVSAIELFNIKAYREGEYFPVGEKLIKDKYEIIFKNLLDSEADRKDIKDELKVYDRKIKILGTEAKQDTSINESKIILSNKINSLEEKRDVNVSKFEQKIDEIKENTIIKDNKNEEKSKVQIDKIKVEMDMLKKDGNADQKIALLKKEISKIKNDLVINADKNQAKELVKLLKIEEKINEDKTNTKEAIIKAKTDQKEFTEKAENKITIIKAKRDDLFKG